MHMTSPPPPPHSPLQGGLIYTLTVPESGLVWDYFRRGSERWRGNGVDGTHAGSRTPRPLVVDRGTTRCGRIHV